MQVSAKEISFFLSGILTGDENAIVTGLAKIEEAEKNQLTFLYLSSYEKFFHETKASVIIVKKGFNKSRNDITYIEVDDPNKSFFKVLINYFSPEFPLEGIDETAFVHPSVKLGSNCAIGKNVVIPENCEIGNNTKIFHNTVLGPGVKIGDNTLIFQNVSIREFCIIGNRVIIHPGTVIGSDGFGFFPIENKSYVKIPQIGNVVIENDVEIGANCAIDRASLGSTIIKRGVKIDNLVQIAHSVIIGEDTVISAQSGVSGSTKIGKRNIIAGQVGIVGHIEISDDVILAAKSGISKSITKPGQWFGYPAKEHKTALKIEAHLRNLPEYVEKIKLLEKEIEELKIKLSNNE